MIMKIIRRLLTLSVLLMAVVAFAQTTTTNAPPATAAREMSLWDWFVVGGWCMWPLLACSIVGFAYGIRNYIVLQNKKLLRQDLLPSLQETLQRGDLAAARQICSQNPCLFTAILDTGLERAETSGIDIAAMEKSMEEASTEQMSNYMVPINVVNTIAVIAPMLGLLGTVSGMIKAFFNISMGGMGKPEMLANNIGEALITTEAGLVVAIPAMTAYFLFKTNFVKAVAQAGKNIGKLTDLLRPYTTQAPQ